MISDERAGWLAESYISLVPFGALLRLLCKHFRSDSLSRQSVILPFSQPVSQPVKPHLVDGRCKSNTLMMFHQGIFSRWDVAYSNIFSNDRMADAVFPIAKSP